MLFIRFVNIDTVGVVSLLPLILQCLSLEKPIHGRMVKPFCFLSGIPPSLRCTKEKTSGSAQSRL